MTSSSQGFFETLVINQTIKKQPEIITEETKENNTKLCNKVFDSIDKINTEYFIPSQFPNITKIKLIKKEPFIQFNMKPQLSKSNNKNKLTKNKSLKKK